VSRNVYLKKHVYKGHEEAHLDVEDEYGRNWLGAFDEVDPDSALWRAVNEDNPLVHVCLLADRIYWAMPPEHVRALAEWFSTLKIFDGETHDMTGREFLDIIDGYTSAPMFKIGEWFA